MAFIMTSNSCLAVKKSLYCIGPDSFAQLKLDKAAHCQIRRVKNQVSEHGELGDLLVVHCLRMDDVTDVDNVRLEQLMEWITWFRSSYGRRDRPVFDGTEPMRDEALSPQF